MSHIDKLGINVFNGSYPELIRVKPKTLESVSNWFEIRILFNPITLTWLRYIFLNVIRQQRTAIESMDELTRKNLLSETRNQLMRQGFKTNLVGNLFVLLEQIWQSHWKENLSANAAWAAFLMLKGCAVEVRRTEKEQAMLLCACTAALIDIPVHWIVSDERSAITLVEKNAIFFQALDMESPLADREKPAIKKQVMIVTAERLARDYLWDKQTLGRSQGHLRLLLHKLGGDISSFSQLQKKGLCFALIENIDFWLMEKAFATVEMDNGEQQITLHELFSRHLRCAGNLLSPQSLNKALWNRYKVVPIALSDYQKGNKYFGVSFFKNLDQKWEVIAKKLVEINQANEKACLIVTTSESLDNLHHIDGKPPIVKEIRGKITNQFHTNNLLVLAEPFPWLGLEEWLNDTNCRLIIVDFCDSLRLLHHLERMCSSAIPIEMIFSLEDNWLQKIDIPSIHYWLRQLLRWRETVNGKMGSWLLKWLLSKVETKRKRLNSEMNRWLWQKERMFSFFKK
ncbi:hypothetical protein [Candidatus Parabeggiatoa sp. HSG14]|uniref:hypothetical protein n=1 Tax=Candidatus Parabeggiatoa sp. HSG14 TaxID=3055593 RepID=UPI0025A76B0C|nr:hypothetical protein [Thiotrichales bacterium HSG14]